MPKKRKKLINHGWTQIITVVLANASLIMWFQGQSRDDFRRLDSKIDANMQAIHAEMKDFHGRLCTIEERNSNRETR